jgi:hypothetical protein
VLIQSSSSTSTTWIRSSPAEAQGFKAFDDRATDGLHADCRSHQVIAENLGLHACRGWASKQRERPARGMDDVRWGCG